VEKNGSFLFKKTPKSSGQVERRDARDCQGDSKCRDPTEGVQSFIEDNLASDLVLSGSPAKRSIEKLFQSSTTNIGPRPPTQAPARRSPDLDKMFTASTLRSESLIDSPPLCVSEPTDTQLSNTQLSSTQLMEPRPHSTSHKQRVKRMVNHFATLGRSVKRKTTRNKIRGYVNSDSTDRQQNPESLNPNLLPVSDLCNSTDPSEKNKKEGGLGKETLVIEVVEYTNSDPEEDW